MKIWGWIHKEVEGKITHQKPILINVRLPFRKAVAISFFPVPLSLRASHREAWQSLFFQSLCHCEPAVGGRGNLVFRENEIASLSLAMTDGWVVITNLPEASVAIFFKSICHCEPAVGGRGNLVFRENEIASLSLAMTDGWVVITNLPEASVAIFFKSICHCEPPKGRRGNLFFSVSLSLRARRRRAWQSRL